MEQVAQQWCDRVWHCVGVSARLAPNGVKAVHAGEEDVVLWRQRDGRAHAWHNQCPHRGVRLSLGTVRNDRLTCRYHGWQFTADARCAYVPADPDFVPSDALCARPFTCVERDGFIWVYTDTDRIDPPAPPEQLTGAVSGQRVGIRSLHVRRVHSQVRAALAGDALPAFAGRTPVLLQAQGGAGSAQSQAAQPPPGQSPSEQPLLLRLDDAATLVIAVQPQPREQTALHVVAAPSRPLRDPTALSLDVHRWLLRLRRCLEQPTEGA